MDGPVKGKILNPDQRRDLLVRASRTRAPIEISVRRETDEVLFSSTLLPNRFDNVSETLRIARPRGELADQILVPKAHLRVRLTVEDGTFWFLSVLVGPVPNSQEMLFIESPQTMVEDLHEDRAHYRVRKWFRPQPVTIWSIPQKGDPAPRGFWRWDGVIADLSGGGIGVRLDSTKAAAVGGGEVVGLFWSFGPGDPPYVLKGVVRNKEVIAETRFTKVGIEFMEAFNRAEYQAMLNRLIRFITDQERTLLKKKK